MADIPRDCSELEAMARTHGVMVQVFLRYIDEGRSDNARTVLAELRQSNEEITAKMKELYDEAFAKAQLLKEPR